MSIRFIDLFAGIGGIRLAFESAGCKCVFSSEIDESARKTYEANFGEKPSGDIRNIKSGDIPAFDILLAGFPCQAFSIIGRREGFDDMARGTLFFEILRILKDRRPEAFMLENVKNLTAYDKGKTFRIIIQCLENLGSTAYMHVCLTLLITDCPRSARELLLPVSVKIYFSHSLNLYQNTNAKNYPTYSKAIPTKNIM